MKSRNLGILSAVFASSCCAVPLLLVMVGLGGIGVGGFLGKYHSYLQGASVVFLAAAWGVWYREKRRSCVCASDLRVEKSTPKMLAVASIVVAYFIGSTLYPIVLGGAMNP